MPCKHETEVYSRIVGYYRPVQQWNKGKQAEFARRTVYALTPSLVASERPSPAGRGVGGEDGKDAD